MPQLLPFDLTTVEHPRSPSPKFPKEVNDLLSCFAGGEVEEAAAAAEQRLAGRLRGPASPHG